MKKQSKLSKMHESLEERHRGPHKQKMSSRVHEAEGMDHHSKAMHHHKEMHKHLKKMKHKM